MPDHASGVRLRPGLIATTSRSKATSSSATRPPDPHNRFFLCTLDCALDRIINT
jgi:hypothetical protein